MSYRRHRRYRRHFFSRRHRFYLGVGGVAFIGWLLYEAVIYYTGYVVTGAVLLAATGATYGGIRWYLRHRNRKAFLSSGITQVDQWLQQYGRPAGHLFEQWLGAKFQAVGHRVKDVGSEGRDFGTDLILDGYFAVQAKLYDYQGRHFVGNDAVQQAASGLVHYLGRNRGQAVVITNSYFTQAAKVQAKDLDVILIDREGTVALGSGRRVLNRPRRRMAA